MQWSLVLLILFAAALHASWNVLIKSESGDSSNTVSIIAGSAIIGVVFLPFVPLPLAACWPYLGASVVIHIVYFGVLLLAYKKGDLSLVYPLMRGLPPVVTALAASILLQESLSARGWMGIALVSTGALVLTVNFRLSEKFKPAPVVLAVLEAAIIVIYTLVDAQGARLSGHAFSYTGWMLFCLAMFFMVIMPVFEGRQVFYRIIKNWKKKPDRRNIYFCLIRNSPLGHNVCTGRAGGRATRNLYSLWNCLVRRYFERTRHSGPGFVHRYDCSGRHSHQDVLRPLHNCFLSSRRGDLMKYKQVMRLLLCVRNDRLDIMQKSNILNGNCATAANLYRTVTCDLCLTAFSFS